MVCLQVHPRTIWILSLESHLWRKSSRDRRNSKGLLASEQKELKNSPHLHCSKVCHFMSCYNFLLVVFCDFVLQCWTFKESYRPFPLQALLQWLSRMTKCLPESVYNIFSVSSWIQLCNASYKNFPVSENRSLYLLRTKLICVLCKPLIVYCSPFLWYLYRIRSFLPIKEMYLWSFAGLFDVLLFYSQQIPLLRDSF